MRKNKDESYYCRVCGLEQDFQPWGKDGKTPAFEICGCCGVDFGYQDCSLKYVKPTNWSLEEQLKNIPKEYR
jgi:hypothetical protein